MGLIESVPGHCILYYLCWSPFLIKFIEKRPQHWCFPLHIRKFLRTSILKNISERLLLIILFLQHFICFRLSLYNYKEKQQSFGEENVH